MAAPLSGAFAYVIAPKQQPPLEEASMMVRQHGDKSCSKSVVDTSIHIIPVLDMRKGGASTKGMGRKVQKSGVT